MTQPTTNGQPSPLPWRLHNTGSYIAILDASGKPVLRKTTNMLSIDQYRSLRANLEFVVAACTNAAGLAASLHAVADYAARGVPPAPALLEHIQRQLATLPSRPAGP